MNVHRGITTGRFWLKRQALLNSRILKYGIVGCSGIGVNLSTMALLLAVVSGKGWMLSAIANVVSTLSNFFLHNVWTFSDQQHQGSRLIRGFLSFVLISSVSICITTIAYAGISEMASHLLTTTFHRSTLGIPMACQLVAIPLGAGASYLLNRKFTWPQAETNSSAHITQVQEI